MTTPINQLTEQQIIDDALDRGFTVEEVTNQRGQPGYRVNGSRRPWQPSEWVNAANNRLYELQNAK